MGYIVGAPVAQMVHKYQLFPSGRKYQDPQHRMERRSPGLRLLPPAVHQSSPQALLCARSDLTVPLRPHASTTFSSAVYYRCSAVHGYLRR
ncbi:unnamed protein product [Gadus morhua 'NCC']